MSTGLLLAAGSAQSQIPVLEYAKMCAKLIYEVPDLDCRAGSTIIPITGVKQRPFMEICDTPSILSGCDKHSTFRVHRPVGKDGKPDPDRYFAMLCRHPHGPNSKKFGQVLGIHFNARTGTTCWYHGDTIRKSGPASSVVSSPTREKTANTVNGLILKANDFWDPISKTGPDDDPCGACHENDPILFSPWLDQLRTTANALPAGDSSAGLAYANYRHTGNGGPFPDWATPVRFRPKGNSCVTCHSFGFVGRNGFQTKGFIHTATGQTNFSSKGGKTLWMPPPSHPIKLGEFSSLPKALQSDIRQIERCFDESRKLNVPRYLADLEAGRASVIGDCDWHFASIELGASSVSLSHWANGKLHGRARVSNASRYAARDVKVRIDVGDAQNNRLARVRSEVDVPAAGSTLHSFKFDGLTLKNKAADVAKLTLFADDMEDAALAGIGEFLERRESDNEKSVALSLTAPDLVVDGISAIVNNVNEVAGTMIVRYDGSVPAHDIAVDVSYSQSTAPHGFRVRPIVTPNRISSMALGDRVKISFRIASPSVGINRVTITGEVDTANSIPESSEGNNKRSITLGLPTNPPGGVVSGAGTGLPPGCPPECDIFEKLIKHRTRVFNEFCARARVTSDSRFCNGLELLPKLRLPEDIVNPRPRAKLYEEIGHVLADLKSDAGSDPGLDNLVAETLLAAQSGVELPDFPFHLALFRIAEHLPSLTREPLYFNPVEPVNLVLNDTQHLRAEAFEGEGGLQISMSDFTVMDVDRLIPGMPFYQLSGSAERPPLSVFLDDEKLALPVEPVLAVQIGSELELAPGFRDPDTGRLTAKIPPEADGFTWVLP